MSHATLARKRSRSIRANAARTLGYPRDLLIAPVREVDTKLSLFLRSRIGFFALGAATLTLAVGANLLVFTIVNAVWLRPRPVTDPGRVVVISALPIHGGSPVDWVKPAQLSDLRRLSVFDGVAGQVAADGMKGDFQPRVVIDRIGHPVETLAVTAQYLQVLRVGVVGRDFSPEDDQLGATPVAIVSDRLWKSAFGAARDLVGTTLSTSSVPLQVIRIAPADFRGARLGEQIDLWIPRELVLRTSNLAPVMAAGARTSWMEDMMPLVGLARLRHGVSSQTPSAALQSHARRLRSSRHAGGVRGRRAASCPPSTNVRAPAAITGARFDVRKTNSRGIHKSICSPNLAPRKSAGAMPITCSGTDEVESVVPTRSLAAPNALFHSRSLTIATGAAPSWSSSGLKSRPTTLTRSTEKY